MRKMNGPKRIVELQEDSWPNITPDDVLVHDGKLWNWVPGGCVLCVESKDQTLKAVDDDIHVCRTHGELEKVPYVIERQYVIMLGDRRLTGSKKSEDFFLFPQSQSPEERTALLDKILAEADEYEDEHDPLMEDE